MRVCFLVGGGGGGGGVEGGRSNIGIFLIHWKLQTKKQTKKTKKTKTNRKLIR